MTRNDLLVLTLLITLFTCTMGKTNELIKEDLDRLEDIEYRQNLLLSSQDEQTGNIDRYYINDDSMIWALNYQLNPEIKNLTSLTTLETRVSKKYTNFWIDLCVARTQARFKDMGSVTPNIANTYGALAESQDSAFFVGAGISNRYYWIQHVLSSIIETSDIFESTHVQVGYLRFSENYLSHTFTGPALKTDFLIHKRLSPRLHLGTKMSYTIGSVKRSPISQEESSSQRALNLSWLTFGVELGFYL